MRSAIPYKRQVTRVRAQPNSALRVRCDCIASRDLSLEKLLAHFEIADAEYESSGRAFTFRPNIAVDILCKTQNQTQRLMIGVGQTPEVAIFVEEERVVNANKHVAITIFQQWK